MYTGQILKEVKPDDLPVVQLTELDLVINVKTARKLGLDLLMRILPRADDVIE